MNCIEPPAPETVVLLAYLDGDGGPEIAAHMDRCPFCRRRVEDMRQWQISLGARLFRAACPPSLEIGEYHLGLLSPERQLAVAQHLLDCPHCAAELADLRGFVADLGPLPQAGPLAQARKQAQSFFARLVGGGSTAQPLALGLRGDEAAPLIFEAGDAQIILEVVEDCEQAGRQTIVGLLIGLDDASVFTARLWQAGQPSAASAVDSLGNFTFAGLAPATYDLILSSPAQDIHMTDIAI